MNSAESFQKEFSQVRKEQTLFALPVGKYQFLVKFETESALN
jgi:hypothetical protein|tara:strand:+ start:5741 stop:5866 length:126 start_codon:yes stop_codon:yes gene_type:complete